MFVLKPLGVANSSEIQNAALMHRESLILKALIFYVNHGGQRVFLNLKSS